MVPGYFVSDLHLFTSRSRGHKQTAAICRKALHAKTFVLGGDIFDFRWAPGGSIDEAVEQAVDWLRRLTAHSPGCQFHYLLGNHDYHQTFIDRLVEVEATTANLSWHRFHLRLGSDLFLHGDVADRKMNATQLARARSRWLYDTPRGPILNRLYDLAVSAGVHKPVPRLVYPKRVVARRILAYLEDVGHGPRQGVRHVYFGHTHLPVSDYRYGGLTFFNGGAPIKGLDFRIVELRP